MRGRFPLQHRAGGGLRRRRRRHPPVLSGPTARPASQPDGRDARPAERPPGDRVLEVGAGTGFNAALLGRSGRPGRDGHRGRHAARGRRGGGGQPAGGGRRAGSRSCAPTAAAARRPVRPGHRHRGLLVAAHRPGRAVAEGGVLIAPLCVNALEVAVPLRREGGGCPAPAASRAPSCRWPPRPQRPWRWALGGGGGRGGGRRPGHGGPRRRRPPAGRPARPVPDIDLGDRRSALDALLWLGLRGDPLIVLLLRPPRDGERPPWLIALTSLPGSMLIFTLETTAAEAVLHGGDAALRACESGLEAWRAAGRPERGRPRRHRRAPPRPRPRRPPGAAPGRRRGRPARCPPLDVPLRAAGLSGAATQPRRAAPVTSRPAPARAGAGPIRPGCGPGGALSCPPRGQRLAGPLHHRPPRGRRGARAGARGAPARLLPPPAREHAQDARGAQRRGAGDPLPGRPRRGDLGAPRGGADLRRRRRPHDGAGRRAPRARGGGGRPRRRRGAHAAAVRAARRARPHRRRHDRHPPGPGRHPRRRRQRHGQDDDHRQARLAPAPDARADGGHRRGGHVPRRGRRAARALGGARRRRARQGPGGLDPGAVAFDAVARAPRARRGRLHRRHRGPPAHPARPHGGAHQGASRDHQADARRAARDAA